jgi:hypothetical protein
MTRILTAFYAALLATGFAAGGAPAAFAAGAEAAKPSAAMPLAAEFSGQERPRPRTRVRIYREPEPAFWDYPRPGTYSWPGPNAKRDCKAWYVVENRATGPTLTPRMTCRWVPG